MLNERKAAAANVAKNLFKLERAIDEGILAAGEMASSLPQARIDAGFSAVVGQAAFDHAAAILGSLVSGRQTAVSLHESLAALRDQLGLRGQAVAFGDGDKLPPIGHSANDVEHSIAQAS